MGQEAPGYRIRLLDPDDKVAEEGEVCIMLDPAPTGLMRGYQNDDGSFAPLGQHAYRTGDVASRHRRLPDLFRFADDVFNPRTTGSARSSR